MPIKNIVFMGTPEFAVPCLDILNQHYNVTAVYTQPDRPKGRGQKLAMSPVKEYALKHNLPVYQPEKIKTPECVAKLRELKPSHILFDLLFHECVHKLFGFRHCTRCYSCDF